MPPISHDLIKESFGRNDLKIFTDKNQLIDFLLSQHWENQNLLMMSSGNYEGLDFKALSEQIFMV